MRAGFHSTFARPSSNRCGVARSQIIAFRYLLTRWLLGVCVCVCLSASMHTESRTTPQDKAKEEWEKKNYLISKIYRLVRPLCRLRLRRRRLRHRRRRLRLLHLSTFCGASIRSFVLHSYANTRLPQFCSPRRTNESKKNTFYESTGSQRHTPVSREGNGWNFILSLFVVVWLRLRLGLQNPYVPLSIVCARVCIPSVCLCVYRAMCWWYSIRCDRCSLSFFACVFVVAVIGDLSFQYISCCEQHRHMPYGVLGAMRVCLSFDVIDIRTFESRSCGGIRTTIHIQGY